MASGDGLIPLRVGDVQVVSNLNQDLNKDTDRIFIEAIGPRWRGGDYQEEHELASCYSKAMDLAKYYNVRSVAFTPSAAEFWAFPPTVQSTLLFNKLS